MLMLALKNFFEYVYVSPEIFFDYAYVRDHSLFMTGGGLAKKGLGHEVFLTEKGGGARKSISSEGEVQLFYCGGKFDT